MTTSHDRGHKIEYKNGHWYYADNGERCFGQRACKRCNIPPTSGGYDACLGYIQGVKSACCGHGAHEPILIENES